MVYATLKGEVGPVDADLNELKADGNDLLTPSASATAVINLLLEKVFGMPLLLELAFCPPVQFFVPLLHHRSVVLEQHENYQKGSYRNRCHIATGHGLQRLSVPLEKGKNHQTPIKEVRIANEVNWQAHHWDSLRIAYNNSPYFDDYEPFIHSLFKQRFHFLWDLNWAWLEKTTSLLGLPLTCTTTSNFARSLPADWLDLRGCIHPKATTGTSSCPPFAAPPYPQVFQDKHGFIANLSILDLLFCMGPESILVLYQSHWP